MTTHAYPNEGITRSVEQLLKSNKHKCRSRLDLSNSIFDFIYIRPILLEVISFLWAWVMFFGELIKIR